jgi:hypothetical protein
MVGNIKITAIKRISKINILDYKYVEPKTTPVKPQNTIEICTSSRVLKLPLKRHNNAY